MSLSIEELSPIRITTVRILYFIFYMGGLILFADFAIKLLAGGTQGNVWIGVVIPAFFGVLIGGQVTKQTAEAGSFLYIRFVGWFRRRTGQFKSEPPPGELKRLPGDQFFFVCAFFLIFFLISLSYSLFSTIFFDSGMMDFDRFQTASENREENEKNAPIYLKNAEANFRRAIAFDPDNQEAYYSLGFISDYLGDHTEARTMYWIAARGGHQNAYNNLARLDILEGRFVQAADSLRRVCYLLNDNTSTDQQRGQNCDHFDFANVNLKELDGDDETRAVYFAFFKNLGWLFVEQGAFERADILLEQASTIDPYMAFPYCLRARIFEAQNDEAQANVQWRRCANRDSKILGLPEEYSWISYARWMRALKAR